MFYYFFKHTSSIVFNLKIMGDFEVFLAITSISILAVLVYNVITVLSFKDLLRRLGFMKNSRRDFYECGFKPQNQRPVKISLQFLLICVFFLLYDIELVFLFPYASGYTFTGLYDLLLLILFFVVLFTSLNVDYERHALYWQS